MPSAYVEALVLEAVATELVVAEAPTTGVGATLVVVEDVVLIAGAAALLPADARPASADRVSTKPAA